MFVTMKGCLIIAGVSGRVTVVPGEKLFKQKGNNKLSGFQKGVNLEDVEPEEPPKPDPPTIEPIPTTKALADPAQEVGVFGRPEFISNERVKGVINVSGFKKPVKKDKSKRVVIML